MVNQEQSPMVLLVPKKFANNLSGRVKIKQINGIKRLEWVQVNIYELHEISLVMCCTGVGTFILFREVYWKKLREKNLNLQDRK